MDVSSKEWTKQFNSLAQYPFSERPHSVPTSSSNPSSATCPYPTPTRVLTSSLWDSVSRCGSSSIHDYKPNTVPSQCRQGSIHTRLDTPTLDDKQYRHDLRLRLKQIQSPQSVKQSIDTFNSSNIKKGRSKDQGPSDGLHQLCQVRMGDSHHSSGSGFRESARRALQSRPLQSSVRKRRKLQALRRSPQQPSPLGVSTELHMVGTNDGCDADSNSQNHLQCKASGELLSGHAGGGSSSSSSAFLPQPQTTSA